MLKITKIRESATEVGLKLEGKITEQWASLLDGECRAFLRQQKAVCLDCGEVDYIDQRGVEVMNNFPWPYVTLVDVPGFVLELLQRGGRS